MLRLLRYPLLISVLVFGLFNCAGSKKSKTVATDAKLSAQGKELFTTNCVSCHALEHEEIGPRLGGVTSLLSEKELIDFVKNPNKAIEAGNQRAVALTRRYKMIMPPFDFLTNDEIKSILAYIKDESEQHHIQPLVVKAEANTAVAERLAAPITKAGLKIETEDFITIPSSSEKMPKTRIANMRPHPSADGTLFVSDQRGIIHRIENNQTNVFLDIRPLIENYVNEPGLGTGLGSFAFHPDYQNNGLIYITHTEAFKGKRADYEFPDSIKVALQWVVSEWKINDVKSKVFEGKRRELIRINVPSVVHGTQDIGFVPGIGKSDPDYGMLYIGTGDGGSTIAKHPELCHKLGSLLGTIIRIDPAGNNSKNGSYGIPTDNPFVNNADPATYKEIYAYGFRNPHRLYWDMTNGKTLFSAEVGESNFEEVNVIKKGGDYGWNVQEGNYGISYKDLKNVYKLPDANKFVKPFALYDHVDGNAISGGAVYEGQLEALKHKYIFGDIVSGRIFYVPVDKYLSPSPVHELTIMQGSKETNLVEMSGSKRVDLRIEYDLFSKQMYIMTKSDGKIRKVTKAYFDKIP
ncbi:PQQ-dependent sugar dehydrogenase [Dyadobacter pollutisoli]|uniref:PQQ-dependent sugar dehydrogenase n=1 Tax=Dyadobacter pollutisoli TaxID=2910158 RepID=A0A9E8SNI5_9BACT|nr:PQQ-dependent sugar dehydrogenase [Dyadobacter pollutisoli]WAC13756.1 PQQ-dependent sugar dehydrogenase [Dyadobacter pollutisoli]